MTGSHTFVIDPRRLRCGTASACELRPRLAGLTSGPGRRTPRLILSHLFPGPGTMIGRTVGKYRILERLGRGGMGTVYKAIDETLDREVAIKVLNADLGDTDLLKRFRAEAVTLARLNHPGIATLYELYRDDDDLLMVMEFVRGETVHELSERLGALAAPQAAHLAMQVLDALVARASRRRRPSRSQAGQPDDHRDGIVKVMDFGIARVLGTEHFTQGGYMMGTPAYMAPEQVLGGDIDGRADLYAVGVVLYRLLSGQLPFSADTAIAMVQKQVNDSPIPIAQFQPDLPPWCARVLTRALAKSPGDRFQTADEFRTALLSAVQPQTLGELPTMATPTPFALASRPRDDRDCRFAGRAAFATISAQRGALRDAAGDVGARHSTPLPRRPAPSGPAPDCAGRAGQASGRQFDDRWCSAGSTWWGLGAVALVIVCAGGAAAIFVMRRSAFPQQMQIGAVPADEAKPAVDTRLLPAIRARRRRRQCRAPPAAAANAPAAATAGSAAAPPAKAGRPVRPTAAWRPGAATAPGARGARGAVPPPTAGASRRHHRPPPPPAAAAPAHAPVTFNDVRAAGEERRQDARAEWCALARRRPHHGARQGRRDRAGVAALHRRSPAPPTRARSSRSGRTTRGRKSRRRSISAGSASFRSERNWVIFFSNGEPTLHPHRRRQPAHRAAGDRMPRRPQAPALTSAAPAHTRPRHFSVRQLRHVDLVGDLVQRLDVVEMVAVDRDEEALADDRRQLAVLPLAVPLLECRADRRSSSTSRSRPAFPSRSRPASASRRARRTAG